MKLPDLRTSRTRASSSTAPGRRRGAGGDRRQPPRSISRGWIRSGRCSPPPTGWPEHFGDNWDALADCLEDGDWLGKSGVAIRIAHSAAYRKAHPHDWETAEEILAEAAEFWRERHLPFWVLVA
jgi:hypothetical protein